MDSVNRPAPQNNSPPLRPDVPAAAPDVPISFAAWLRGNAMGLLIMAGVLVGAFLYFGEEGFWNVIKVALGLSCVIFIHELGHFAVAKWCDVHVETFSIGFGPALPGCSFKRGETTYKIALFPLGGYVKMLGEGEGEGEGEEDHNPRSFKNKPVGQRMAIISAGVVMNLISGCLFFVGVYLAYGERRIAGSIGSVDPGSPAWQAGVRSDSNILQIGPVDNPYFDDFQRIVMLSGKGEEIPLAYTPAEPPGQRFDIKLEPRRDEHNLQPMIGIASSSDLKLVEKRRRIPWPVAPGSAAARAEPPFEFGDVILGMSDPADPKKVTTLRGGSDGPEQAHVRYREFRRRLEQLARVPAVIQVRRAEDGKVVDITVPATSYYTLGLRMRMGQIVAVREGSPARRFGVQVPDPAKNLDGDIITEVELPEKNGTTKFVDGPPQKGERELDPVRLPWELREWAARRPDKAPVRLRVLRKTERGREPAVLELKWDEVRQYDREEPNHLQSPLSIPALGLAYRVENTVAGVRAGSPADKEGVKEGDVVKAVRFPTPGKKPGEFTPGRWDDLEPNQWARVAAIFQHVESDKIGLRLERGSEKLEVELVRELDETWPRADKGLLQSLDAIEHLQTADGSFFKALELGVNKTYRSIVTIYLSLKAMIVGRISPKQIGGPIMIARVAYDFAGQGFYEFLMFLALISINLAVVNFLPIPLLDGGHMVFLIYEKLRGKPASDRVLWIAMIVGIAMIAAIFLFASYQDILREWARR